MRAHTRTFALVAASALTPWASGETIVLTAPGATPIPDLGQAVVVLPATPLGNPVVAAVTVDLDITHPWIGDLVITIEHAGQVVRLTDRVGLGAYPFACGGDDIAATFEDGAPVTAEDLCGPGPGPTVAGTVAPVDPLAAFQGLAAGGDWTVRIVDSAAYDAGTVVAATIRVVLAPPTECIGDVNGDTTTNALDFNILAGNFGATVAPNTNGDLNGDGEVNALDFNILAGDFGCSLPT